MRAEQALERTGLERLAVGGGVAANGELRRRLRELGATLHVPPRALCTDNAAMIASAARFGRAAALPATTSALDAYATGERPLDRRLRSGSDACRQSPSTPSPTATCARGDGGAARPAGASSASSSSERDITADEALHRAYFERIPVVALDGEELCEYFVEEALVRERLESRR